MPFRLLSDDDQPSSSLGDNHSNNNNKCNVNEIDRKRTIEIRCSVCGGQQADYCLKDEEVGWREEEREHDRNLLSTTARNVHAMRPQVVGGRRWAAAKGQPSTPTSCKDIGYDAALDQMTEEE